MSVVRQYWSLTKPRVVALIVFTALVGMLLAIDGMPDAQQFKHGALGFLGIWLAASSAAAINQILDARIDAKMARTSWRPLVVGQLQPWQALVFALALATMSMTVLVLWVNTITAVLTFASLMVPVFTELQLGSMLSPAMTGPLVPTQTQAPMPASATDQTRIAINLSSR